MTFISNYIDKYITLMFEYFQFVEDSEFLKTILNKDFLVSLGFRTITHVYKMNYLYTSDMNESYLSSQKAFYYYFEYLEQIYKTNMSNDLNHMDAVLFVYNKTIHNYSTEQTHNAPIVNERENEIRRIINLIDILLWWANNHIKRDEKLFDIFVMYIKLFYHMNDDMLISYIELSQHKLMTNDEYIEFLQLSHKLLKSMIKKQILPSLHEWKDMYLYKLTNLDESSTMTMNEHVKWLLSRENN